MADETVAPRPGQADIRWRKQGAGAAPFPDRDARRRRGLFVLAGLFLTLLALAVAWILHIKPLPPSPFFLSIKINEHNARQYPPIPFVKQDDDRLKRHFSAAKLAETKTRELLRKELAGLADMSGTVICAIDALALVRENTVYLLPGDADPADDSTWLDVQEVLAAVRDCPAEHKLLILDLAHPLADPRLGVLTDRVAETLEDMLQNEPPPFHVLCSCSAGQYALTSESLQGSILVRYVDLALQGDADADKDLRVTVKELAAFVEARVDRWAQKNLALRQKPRLFGKADDFVIATLSRDSPGLVEPAEPAAYPERLKTAWKERDDWWNKEAFCQAPRLYRKLETTLLRQDQLWRGGADIPALDDDVRNLKEKLQRTLTVRHAPPRSLALALTQAGQKDDPAVVEGVLDIFTRVQDSGAKKEVNKKVEEELKKKLQEPKDVDFPRQASAVLEALCRVPRLRADHLRVSKEVLTSLQTRQQYAEVIYVERLAGLVDRRDLDAVQLDKLQALLQTVRTREAVVALLDREPGPLPWLGAELKETDALRQVAEDKLLWKGMSTWEDAFDKLQSARKKYEAALVSLNILREALWHLDRAFAELPSYVELLCAWPDLDVPADLSWNKAVDEALRVEAFFLAPPEPGTVPTASQELVKLESHGRELKRHLQDLGKMLERRIARATKEERADELRQMLILLESSLLKEPQRLDLFARQRSLGKKLSEANDKLDQDDNQANRLSPLPDAPRRSETLVGLGRARMSLALLRLGRFDLKGKSVSVPATDGKLGPQAWTSLESRLQEIWLKDLPLQWHNARPGFTADALNRIVSPWELERWAGSLEREPSRVWQQQLRDSFLRWLQDRYRAEAMALAANPGERPASVFFAEAAHELGFKGIE